MGVHSIGTGTSLVLDLTEGRAASTLWFGPGEGIGPPGELAALVGPYEPLGNHHDAAATAVPLLPGPAQGWPGRATLAGRRPSGADWLYEFVVTEVVRKAELLTVTARDAVAALTVHSELQALPGGAVRVRHTVVNEAVSPYCLDWFDVAVPVPACCVEQLDLTGRWARERIAQRRPIADGVWLREGRWGKPGPDAATLLTALHSGTGFGTGAAWGVHPAWSGNCRLWLERLPDGRTVLGAGEALLPGEITLAQGEQYRTPWVYLVAGEQGLDGLAEQLHGYQRTLASFPRHQPVTLNVWEAVYFDHDLTKLSKLAALGAEVGVERFVLDDGWFGARRDDSRGLGDWTVSADVWPEGLAPLIDVVHAHGLQFGLWFEPEMINADSDLNRTHPDWTLHDPRRRPLVFRNQLVLDLGRPEVRDHLFTAMDAILARYDIRYVKWDHNRYLFDAADAGGRAAVHAQSTGFDELLDRLRAAHPSVDWESCASGGARIDLAVLERCERVWTSDSTDALTRQQIQRWTTQLVSPAYLGAHVSAPVNHQTGRCFSLDFRAATAFFGAMGIEWDLTSAADHERARLAEWIAAHKQHRELLHTGRVVRVDTAGEQVWIHGVVAPDRRSAIFGYVQLDEQVADPPRFTLAGLAPQLRYRARQLCAGDQPWPGEGVVGTGTTLRRVGLPAPTRRPESVTVVHLQAE